MAYLPRAGREYFYWPIIAAPDDVQFEASVAGNWVAAERIDGKVRLLLEGPDVAPADHDPTATVLPANEAIRFRVKDNPEIIIRTPGAVRLS